MNSRKPKQSPEYSPALPEERLQWVVPDRSSKSPRSPRWQPVSDIAIKIIPERDRSRLH